MATKIIKQTVLLTRAGSTGWSTVGTFTNLRRSGRLLAVKARLDATLNDATAATAYIHEGAPDADLVAVLDSRDTPYVSASTSFTGHATTSDLDDQALDGGAIPPGGAPYDCGAGKNLKIALNITATAGGTTSKFYCTAWALVDL